ncbi:hypothetical protein F4775DRAFT_593335 [Biscogniauxia sp. FL1348]|nr:hypothetical protein F4775DRAFT_593335 [Biscogniauxia sp. FL1348]
MASLITGITETYMEILSDIVKTVVDFVFEVPAAILAEVPDDAGPTPWDTAVGVAAAIATLAVLTVLYVGTLAFVLPGFLCWETVYLISGLMGINLNHGVAAVVAYLLQSNVKSTTTSSGRGRGGSKGFG